MMLSDDVRHAALAPLEAVWAESSGEDDDIATPELTLSVLNAAHEGLLDALLLMAKQIDELKASIDRLHEQ